MEAELERNGGGALLKHRPLRRQRACSCAPVNRGDVWSRAASSVTREPEASRASEWTKQGCRMQPHGDADPLEWSSVWMEPVGVHIHSDGAPWGWRYGAGVPWKRSSMGMRTQGCIPVGIRTQVWGSMGMQIQGDAGARATVPCSSTAPY